ncbi:IspD/TarI family cytidylyltransferase [Phytohabitans rumicis]|uniref:2-C-methyl-D-erythritol 4-phosphate cytidylyltransferase n=1 Tax=Phytohabitans rumicis TaxID=1076125 RepID=A0A6V8KUT7_9ACTN|nr:IspD/TarI family cytidylyltransferase [Phytohabitans rumicis]GFJ87210.1 2-C-methyl-D-erythritol 4-phosphate cytidylyltransferase [Phytohabitans rumicis]
MRNGLTRARAAGVVLAGGSGARFRAEQNKAYLPLAGRSLASWSLRSLAATPDIGALVLVARQEDHRTARWIVEREVDDREVEVVWGGATRQESELNALRHLAGRIDAGEIDVVVIHDAARPLASPTLTAGVIHLAREHGGAIPCVPGEDLVEVDGDGAVTGTHLRRLVRAQTPQAFAAEPLLTSYEAAARAGFVGTDTSSCLERFSTVKVHWLMGEAVNLKITYPQDLFLAEQILATAEYDLF